MIKKNINQTSSIARLLLLSIGLLMSFNTFAMPGGLQAEVTAREAADAALQEQIDNIPIPPVYEIGDTLNDGSIVFYADASGEHGLAAWPEDEDGPFLNWYKAGEAADAHGFRWHLPTKAELALLVAEKDLVGVFEFAGYWSFTEFDSLRAWTHGIINGVQNATFKNLTFRVRAVRAF